MAIVTGDRYLEKLVKFVEDNAGPLIEGTMVLKLNPVGLHYVHSRLEALRELEGLIAGAPVDYLRAYISDLGDHRALDKLGRILRLLTSLKVVSVLPPPARDPTPVSLLPFGRLKVLELRGCDLSTSAARGLLELRNTLEKLICHNSTDALRHVFASRIAEIKDSPQWTRLSFVSCACNGLVLMDESLQLLPAVETLDLSRNKFTKVHNLRKCTKLKHLDLGFNRLRTIESFDEVSCVIVKLVLRNNALTTLRGIENLKSLEELDLSYNILSNFSELEFLEGIPSLRSLWLEGNPLCCTRWYRAHIFGFFSNPERLKLDDKEMHAEDFWKMKLIIARRQKSPASFGFYYPAKEGAERATNINRKTRRVTRLASIESKEESTCLCSDQESVSCHNEIQSREENAVSDDEAEISDLMNRVELLKKERSDLWLRELRDWMNGDSVTLVDDKASFQPENQKNMKSERSQRHTGENSRYVSDSLQASDSDSNINILESESSIMDTPARAHAFQSVDRSGVGGMEPKQRYIKPLDNGGFNTVLTQTNSDNPDEPTVQKGHKVVDSVSTSPLNTIHTKGIHVLLASPSSPPHYREDILHRRHNLVEEILQLSAESSSVAFSDSDSSSSEDDFIQRGKFLSEVDNSMVEGHLSREMWQPSSDNYKFSKEDIFDVRENGSHVYNSCIEKTAEGKEIPVSQLPSQEHSNDLHACSPIESSADEEEVGWLEKRKNIRKPKKRVISLSEENVIVIKGRASQLQNGNMNICETSVEDRKASQILDTKDLQEFGDDKKTQSINSMHTLIGHNSKDICAETSSSASDAFIENYFNNEVADAKTQEICRQYICCSSVLGSESIYREREVILLLSSEDKLYILLINLASDEPSQHHEGQILNLICSHSVQDVRKVLVGIGLQVMRIYIEDGPSYLFITRNVEKSRQLLHMLQVSDSDTINHKCSLRSLEQVQVKLFEKQICAGLEVCISQYSMVLFWLDNSKDELWVSKSLFIIGGYVLICSEDIMRFGSLSMDANSPPYYSLMSCCSIASITELVLEMKENLCVTLAFDRATSEFLPSAKSSKKIAVFDKSKRHSASLTWKIRWFSVNSLSNFVSLLKAIHERMGMSPLLVRCIS